MNDYIFEFGKTVYSYDEDCGKLAKVAVDPKTWRITDIIVEEGLLMKRTRVFPLSVVSWATHEGISLAADEDELKDFPEFKETVVERIAEGESAEHVLVQGSPYGLATSTPAPPTIKERVVEGVDEHLALIDKSTNLKSHDTGLGSVRGLAAFPGSGLVTHLLIHKGAIFTEDFWLPMTFVERFSPKGVFTNVDKDSLETWIHEEKKVETADQSWERQPTNEPLDTADVTASNGPSSSSGNGRSAVMGDDAALASLIADDLMQDERTEDAIIEVVNERGMVTLQGSVTSREVKDAAEEMTRKFPGVVSVSNQLAVDNRR